MTEKQDSGKAARKEVQKQMRQLEVSTAQVHVGPLPSPDQLLKYMVQNVF